MMSASGSESESSARLVVVGLDLGLVVDGEGGVGERLERRAGDRER
jgi:hypothetical protein